MAPSNQADDGADPIEFLALPYSAAAGRSILHVLIEELRSGRWNMFQAAVAFVNRSGDYPDLLDALKEFGEQGNRIELTFGADSFSGEAKGSDYEAVEELFQMLQGLPAATVYLYHEKARTFHPKAYLFSDEDDDAATLLLGSSNWSEGGFSKNVEANLLVRLDLTDHDEILIHNY